MRTNLNGNCSLSECDLSDMLAIPKKKDKLSLDFKAFNFQSEQRTLRSTTDSGKTFRRQVDGQRWAFSLSYPLNTRSEFAPTITPEEILPSTIAGPSVPALKLTKPSCITVVPSDK